MIYHDQEDLIIYQSKLHRIIEDSSSVFLFLVVDGSPNKDHLQAFAITPAKATPVTNSIVSEIKDYDNDGYLEFGGADLTEIHPDKDSMYYIPTAYYEIKKGTIHFDASLTMKMDIDINGIYLKQPIDKNRNCCKVIRKPSRKKLKPGQ